MQVNSGQFDGISNVDGKREISDYIEAKKWGNRTVNYRMRDWLISRQRYWGTPIPVIYCENCGTVPVPEDHLPVLLPEDAEFLPTGESPLALHEGFVNVDCPDCGRPSKRETDTMDTFVDSSWYFLRFCSPKFTSAAFNSKSAQEWGPVDQYTGGVEHAVMHLLYARFFVKAVRDIGLIDFDEPFERLFNQGTIIYKGAKMSKSRGNVIAPDDYVEAVGADVVRTYLMFIGPWEQGGEWNDSGINGAARWLNKVWDLFTQSTKKHDHSNLNEDSERDILRNLHKTIARVGEDIERFKYNTAISSLMQYTNHLTDKRSDSSISNDTWRECLNKLLVLMAPIAPHLSEELWEMSGNKFSVHQQKWPDYDDQLAADEKITLVVQVNGKLRDKIEAPLTISEDEAKDLAMASEKIKIQIAGNDIMKVISVPGRRVKIVVK